ncbi:DUF485 domain-containing protein [Streptomyces sp. B93]|uniref:DUF485 domain-containing protein n=1 Tax=Streptomyces sp. B93 TaxID=2824875 RepID=UPI001B366B98|nr:DUF485 domain-containing protein [Streptomyces sp. B93]MBQ1090327.1 hypothetical protein [Streptomyces sp. B93]
MSLGPQAWHGPPQHEEFAVEGRPVEEAARLRLGVRIAVVWFLYVVVAALAPGGYGARVVGPVSFGVVLAVVPFAVGVHALVVYGRRVDRLEARSDAGSGS